MDDSDEYFDDSFVLDEATLASIQATEERFGASLSQACPSQPALHLQASPSPPPFKRLKISHDSIEDGVAQVTPQPIFRRIESLDLNPDIRVGPDGNYVVSTQSKAPKQAGKSSGDPSRLSSRSLASTLESAGGGGGSGGGLAAELADVRAQLATLNAENAVIQKMLRDAQNTQLMKAGEVTILRQTLDKTNKEHAEVIAKAKADLIAHEKIKAELHAKLKEETERIATRLVFQQHEMETSTRKPAWGSTRSHRIVKDPSMSTATLPLTPTRARGSFPPPSTSYPAHRVSSRKSPQYGEESTSFSSPSRPTRSGEDAKRPRFKGFHNAFIDAEPVMTQSGVSGKEENIEENQRSDPFLTPMKSKESREVESRDSRSGKWRGKGRELDKDLQFDCWEDDARCLEVGEREDMIAVGQEVGRPSFPGGRLTEEDMVIEEGVDWGEELRRIVFTHIAPRNDALTLHILFSTVIPPEVSTEEKDAYTTACQVILETCGTRHGHIQYSDNSEWGGDAIHKVAEAFVTVAGILARTGCVAPLTALLDLLLLLTLYIPAFLSSFLRSPTTNDIVNQLDLDRPAHLFNMLCDVVREHLAPPKRSLNIAENANGKENLRAALAMAVVQLMESLCWNVKDHLVDRLGVLWRQPRVFEILLDPAQAPELIARTLQLLVLLATHQDFLQCLLAVYESDTVNEQASPFMRNSSSLVEKLCYYLVEPAAEESYRIRHLVITLISVLADSHIEGRTILLDSATLSPSIVICIAKLSRLLWEDDIGIMNDPKLAKLTVDILYSSVNLLHYLVFVLDLSPILGRKLVEATRLSGPFNGVTHMFIATFGRLSWAEGPEWLDKDGKDKCEVIAEQAMEIIETVVAGPECDSLWAVWHQFEVTDEEVEAWKIQID